MIFECFDYFIQICLERETDKQSHNQFLDCNRALGKKLIAPMGVHSIDSPLGRQSSAGLLRCIIDFQHEIGTMSMGASQVGR
jgi:hypothetical protein